MLCINRQQLAARVFERLLFFMNLIHVYWVGLAVMDTNWDRPLLVLMVFAVSGEASNWSLMQMVLGYGFFGILAELSKRFVFERGVWTLVFLSCAIPDAINWELRTRTSLFTRSTHVHVFLALAIGVYIGLLMSVTTISTRMHHDVGMKCFADLRLCDWLFTADAVIPGCNAPE